MKNLIAIGICAGTPPLSNDEPEAGTHQDTAQQTIVQIGHQCIAEVVDVLGRMRRAGNCTNTQ